MDDTPPPVQARFFYASLLAIDDPLSPVPPPASSTSASSKLVPRPFSAYDSARLDQAWHDIRREAAKQIQDRAEEQGSRAAQDETRTSSAARCPVEAGHGATSSAITQTQNRAPREHTVPKGRDRAPTVDSLLNTDIEIPSTTGTPFIRAPSRKTVPTARSLSASRPQPQAVDSYQWDPEPNQNVSKAQRKEEPAVAAPQPSAKVPVGVSRLHHVVLPALDMEPIYWSPINDISRVVRATWFYKDTMLPVEVPVANMLELGFTELQAWTQTWQDELNSAIQVGAAGEEKILRMLWPPVVKPVPDSRPGTAKGEITSVVQPLAGQLPDTPEAQRQKQHDIACQFLDAASGPNGQDNRAGGQIIPGRYGTSRTYATAGVIFTSATEACILKPSLQPSSYYGRRPLANYIRKDRKLGIAVVRGFDESVWNRINPRPESTKAAKAYAGASTDASSGFPEARQEVDPQLASSISPKVTDLILVIHGIGQKLSERMESFHFTHAMNAFRREVNVELGSDAVRKRLRKDAGGIMLLPVNWRQTLSFEEGGYRSDTQDPAETTYGLQDITPETLPSVRNIVSDVMLDIPYYLSHHQPKMIAAVIKEANRIYKLWCANNPSFLRTGRVHIIAHSLGSVMALDILSNQPTKIPPHLHDPAKVDLDKTILDHFLFPVSNLFLAGSPAGFFLLLKRAPLRPRLDHNIADRDAETNSTTVCGARGDYGCLPVDNVYNIINPYDPVSYRLNATVDAPYSASLKPAWLPSATQGWFSSASDGSDRPDGVLRGWFGGSAGKSLSSSSATRPKGAARLQSASPSSSTTVLPRLPSNVELATHDFSREEVAERRMYALNDNGQIDFQLKYGGGPLEIQYLTMLGAHSSYWLLKDFVRAVVIECGRERGREGALRSMRAVKKKVT